MRRFSTPVADRLGASLSIACAVHCLSAPILLALLPAWVWSEEIETGVILVSVSLAVFTFIAGFRRHGRLHSLLLLPPALLAIGISRAVHAQWIETLLLVAGASALATAHLWNCRSCRACGD